MVQVTVCRDSSGRLVSCNAGGHAGFAPKGQDIVCAAVTNSVRTVLSLLLERETVSVEAEAPERGALAFRVKAFGEVDSGFLVHCGDFLVRGVDLVAREFPKLVQLRVETETHSEVEIWHGKEVVAAPRTDATQTPNTWV